MERNQKLLLGSAVLVASAILAFGLFYLLNTSSGSRSFQSEALGVAIELPVTATIQEKDSTAIIVDSRYPGREIFFEKQKLAEDIKDLAGYIESKKIAPDAYINKEIAGVTWGSYYDDPTSPTKIFVITIQSGMLYQFSLDYVGGIEQNTEIENALFEMVEKTIITK